MTKLLRFSVRTLPVLIGLLTVFPVQAQEVTVTGPLAGAPSVMRMRVYRANRFLIKLQGAMTLQDEFTRSVILGGQLGYNITDWIGISVWGGFAPVHIDTALTDEITAKGSANDLNILSLPSKKRFSSQIGKINFIIAPQVEFIPLRGKLGLVEKVFVDTDLFVFAGPAFIGVEERSDVSNTGNKLCTTTQGPVGRNCLQSQLNRSSRMAIAPTFGLGLSMYLVGFLSMSIEWRAFPFAWNASGTDEAGSTKAEDYRDNRLSSSDRLFHFNHLVSLGFSFFLPMEPDIAHTGEE